MFIWTISDVVGVIFWGLVLLAVAGFFLWLGVDILWFKIKRAFSGGNKLNR